MRVEVHGGGVLGGALWWSGMLVGWGYDGSQGVGRALVYGYGGEGEDEKTRLLGWGCRQVIYVM